MHSPSGIKCPLGHDLTYEQAQTIWAHARRTRIQQPMGRKPKLKPCVSCGEEFGVRDMRKHTPVCQGWTERLARESRETS